MKKTLLFMVVLLSVVLVGCKKVETIFTITYNLNEGILPSGVKESFTEKELPLQLDIPTKEGHIFWGWYEKVDFSGEAITVLTEAKNYTLFALWEEEEVIPATYTITYNLNGGKNVKANKNSFKESDLPLEIRGASKQYFTFLGWYLTPDFSGEAITSITKEGNVTLYAKWDKGQNIIDYDLDGGDWPYTYPFEDRSAMVDEFITDINAALGLSTSATSFFAVGTYGKDVASFFTMEAYKDKWGWFKTYIINVATSQGYASMSGLNSGDSAIWRSNIDSFLNSTQRSEYPVSANFTTEAAANGFWDLIKIGPIITTTYVEITEDITLINPVRNGYNFSCWVDEDNNPITVVKKGTEGYYKVKAVWDARIFPTEIVINNPLTTSLDKGDTWDLDISLLPLNVEETDLNMVSSNEHIVSIEDGILEAYAYGTVTITIASVYNSSATTTFNVTVAPALTEGVPVIFNSYGTYLNAVIKKGEAFDLTEGIYAYELNAGDVTKDITIKLNGYSNQVVGNYKVEYEVLVGSAKATLERNIIVNEFIWVGHRGCNDECVSNTIEAFEKGIARGYKALECDIKVTKDNQFVIFHNGYLNDATGEKVLTEPYQATTPESKTLAELQAMTVSQTRTTPSGTYTGQIASLGEFLDLCKTNDIIAVIEIKWSTGLNTNDTSNVETLVEFVKSKGWYEKTVFMTSMRAVLDAIRTSYSDATLQWLCGAQATYDSYKDWAITNRISLDIAYGLLTKDIVDEFHSNGLLVNSYTLNAINIATTQINYGIDMITTDYLYHNGSAVAKKFS